MPYRRSLISKIFITSVYVAFFFVQLHLKYAATNAGNRDAYVSTKDHQRTGSQEFIEGKNPHKLNVLLNKRYYPEQPIETSTFFPIVHDQYFVSLEIRVPEQNYSTPPFLVFIADRGPPAFMI
jgi:hypothetical protein